MELPTTSYFIICVFALLINKVSLQDVNVVAVSGVTGGSVVLPCATSEIKDKLSDITVQWRHNGSLTVCAIIEGKFSPQYQHFNYQNRAETFPTEYEKGNFSIKLNNLKNTDAGDYQCFITHSYEEVITQLIIKESTVHKGEQPTEDNENQARERHLWMILTPVFSVFILLCIVLCIIFICKKKCKSHRSRLSPPKRTLPSKDVFHDELELHER